MCTPWDLSKAFERVNPYWILHLLRIRGAPRWVMVYAKFALFQRKVIHKVQGRLLPSRTIRQGVDMGRSFSVYLFCFAMDPLFHYLNRIPGVISVQAYVDDTTIAGVAEDPMWLHEVAEAYQSISTAGFHIDSHSCFRACVIFFLLDAAWVRSRAERPSVSYTKVTSKVAWTSHNLQVTN